MPFVENRSGDPDNRQPDVLTTPPIVFSKDNLRADELLQRARAVYTQNQEQSLALLDQALLLNSRLSRAYDLRADIHLQAGRYQAAASDYATLYALEPTYRAIVSRVRSGLARALREWEKLNPDPQKVKEFEVIQRRADTDTEKLSSENELSGWQLALLHYSLGSYREACWDLLNAPSLSREQRAFAGQFWEEYKKAAGYDYTKVF